MVRLVRFEDVTSGKRAKDIAALIVSFLEEYECLDKIVAQCYDGAAVMSSGQNGVQAKVKERAPIALFLHCRAHRLNLVLTQGASKLKESFLASSMAWLHFSPDPLSARNYWPIFASSASSSCGSNAVAMHIEIGQYSV